MGLAAGAAAIALPALSGRPSSAGAVEAASATNGPLADLSPLPAGAPNRAQFEATEQRLAPYLVVLASLANGVEDTNQSTYGFMTGGFWRSPNQPFNARIQENVYTLSWMYANPRSWNPYAGDPALLARLDAAIGRYLGQQRAAGYWSEYSAGEVSRPATGFALGFLAATLIELRQANALPATQTKIIDSIRKAAGWFLDPSNSRVWSNPIPYTNQVVGGLLGIAEALPYLNSPTIEADLDRQIDALERGSLSTAGYYYEQNGSDLGYSLGVMTPDMAALYEVTGSPVLKRMQERYFDWLSYNFVREPDNAGWFCNVATSSRTSLFFLDDVKDDSYKADINALWTSSIPISAAFTTTAAAKSNLRTAWSASTAPVAPPPAGNVDPQVVRLSTYPERFPTQAVKNAAIATMPYLQSSDFIEFRPDNLGQQYLFVRKPGYYFGGLFGSRPSSRVQSGLSFLWHPAAGMVLYGSNNGVEGCWGTHRSNQYTSIDSNGNLSARYYEGDWDQGNELALDNVATASSLTVRYSPPDGRSTKNVLFGGNSMRIRVSTQQDSTERIPLVLRPTDQLTLLGSAQQNWTPGNDVSASGTGLRIVRGNVEIRISWTNAINARLVPKSQTYFKDATRQQHMLLLPFGTYIDYRITFTTL